MRPMAFMQNQHTRELINAQKMSQKNYNKGPSCLQSLQQTVEIIRTQYCQYKNIKNPVATLNQPVQSTLPRPNNVPGFPWLLPPPPPFPHITQVMLLPLSKIKFLFITHAVSTLAQQSLQNSHTETPDFPVSTLSLRLCHGKSVIQALLYSFIFCSLIAIG